MIRKTGIIVAMGLLIVFVGTMQSSASPKVTLFPIPYGSQGPGQIIAPSVRGIWYVSVGEPALTRLRPERALKAYEYEAAVIHSTVLNSDETVLAPPSEEEVSAELTAVVCEKTLLTGNETHGFLGFQFLPVSMSPMQLSFDWYRLLMTGPHQKVAAFEPLTNQIFIWDVSSLHLDDENPVSPTTGPNGWIWFLEEGTRFIAALDPENDTVHEWAIPGAVQPHVLHYAEGYFWIGDLGADRVWRFSPTMETFLIWELPEGDRVMGFVTDGQMLYLSLWNSNTGDSRIASLNGTSLITWSIPSDFGAVYSLYLNPLGGLILGNPYLGKLAFFDPQSGALTVMSVVPDIPCSSIFQIRDFSIDPEGNIWFTVRASELLIETDVPEPCSWNWDYDYIGVVHHGAFYCLYFPHFDSRPEWWTGIALYNMGGEQAKITICAYDDNGTQVGRFSLTLPGYGKWAEVVSTLFPDATTGWLKVVSSNPLGGFTLFGTREGPSRLAGVQASTTAESSFCIPHFHSGGQWWAGISYLNPDLMMDKISITLRDEDGQLISPAPIEITLGPLHKEAKLVSDLLGTTEELIGSMEITANISGSVIGLEVFGSVEGGIAGVGVAIPRPDSF